MMEKKTKLQVTITGKFADIYKLLSPRLKSKAIEHALWLLARDENLREVFFEDIEKLDAVLNKKPFK